MSTTKVIEFEHSVPDWDSPSWLALIDDGNGVAYEPGDDELFPEPSPFSVPVPVTPVPLDGRRIVPRLARGLWERAVELGGRGEIPETPSRWDAQYPPSLSMGPLFLFEGRRTRSRDGEERISFIACGLDWGVAAEWFIRHPSRCRWYEPAAGDWWVAEAGEEPVLEDRSSVLADAEEFARAAHSSLMCGVAGAAAMTAQLEGRSCEVSMAIKLPQPVDAAAKILDAAERKAWPSLPEDTPAVWFRAQVGPWKELKGLTNDWGSHDSWVAVNTLLAAWKASHPNDSRKDEGLHRLLRAAAREAYPGARDITTKRHNFGPHVGRRSGWQGLLWRKGQHPWDAVASDLVLFEKEENRRAQGLGHYLPL